MDKNQNPDNDLQMTLQFEDGHKQTFTVVRDQDMRWSGSEEHGALIKIEAEWFDNPVTTLQEARG